MDKQTQELYGLINYGEIWKKLGSKSDSKIKHHLNELVNLGYVSVLQKIVFKEHSMFSSYLLRNPSAAVEVTQFVPFRQL